MNLPLQRALENIVVKNNEQLSYPYILDRDPIIAAKYLTIEDGKEAVELLSYTYRALKGKEKSKYVLLERNMQMHAVFDWFAKFYTELINYYDMEGYEEVPYDLKPKGQVNHNLLFFPPLIYKAKKIIEVKFPSKIVDTVSKYRCLYIKKKVQLSDFKEGYPSWYTLSNMTLFEDYNIMTNTRVKLDFKEGEFRYFIAGASDNWKEIRDVPLEMDHVISALIFRS